MKDKVIEFISRYKKELRLALLGFLTLICLIFVVNNAGSVKEVGGDDMNMLQGGVADDIVNKDSLDMLKGVSIGVDIPEDVLYRNLKAFIEENEISDIEDVFIEVEADGIKLGAKYTLMGFIKIPAEFKMVPDVSNSIVRLIIKDVKIMSMKIKIDKIIEKWITTTEDMKDVVSYKYGKVCIDVSKVAPIKVNTVKVRDGSLGVNFTIR